MGFRPRLLAIKALIHAKYPEGDRKNLLKTTDRLIHASQKPSEDRNRIVHDPWYVDYHDTSIVAQHRSMPKDKYIFGIAQVELDGIIASIHCLSTQAMRLGHQLDEVRTGS